MIGTDHRGVHNSLNKQCKKHNHRLFYFLAGYIFRPPNTFVQIQKSIIAGLESCGVVILYPHIVSAMSGDHKLFMFELCKMFGTVLKYNTSAEYIKYMQFKSLRET